MIDSDIEYSRESKRSEGCSLKSTPLFYSILIHSIFHSIPFKKWKPCLACLPHGNETYQSTLIGHASRSTERKDDWLVPPFLLVPVSGTSWWWWWWSDDLMMMYSSCKQNRKSVVFHSQADLNPPRPSCGPFNEWLKRRSIAEPNPSFHMNCHPSTYGCRRWWRLLLFGVG